MERFPFSSNAVWMRTAKSHLVGLAESWETEMRGENLMIPSSQSAGRTETGLQVKGSLVLYDLSKPVHQSRCKDKRMEFPGCMQGKERTLTFTCP